MNWPHRLRQRIPSRAAILGNPWLRWLRPWLGRRALWRWSRRGVTLGFAIGLFFGLLIPVGQIPFAAAVSIMLRANLPVAAATTFISNPFTFPPLFYGAWRLGGWILNEAAPNNDEATRAAAAQTTPANAPEDIALWRRITDTGKPLMLGLAVIAITVSSIAWFVVDRIWRWRTMRRWRQRRKKTII